MIVAWQMLSAAVPLLVVMVFFVLPIYLLLWAKKFRTRKRRSPLTEKLLRGPGETLRRELEDVLWDFSAYLAMLWAIPLLVLAIFLSQSHFGGTQDTAARWIFCVVIMLAAAIYLLFKLLRLAKFRLQMQHGLEAEIAMGQELDQLMREGAIVYHDFPAEGFNIDHVVLTRGAMYAVETKGRMKPDRGGGKKDATVVFDGKSLSFPDWQDSKSVDQAVSQARWLAKWMSRAVGETVHVKPVLALPGWWVDRRSRGDIKVISGKEAKYLLDDQQTEAFSDKLMQQIDHRLEERCRDVEPSQYGKQERFGRAISES